MKKEKKFYKKASFWVTCLAIVILLPILIINMLIIYRANKNPNEIPGIFGYKPLIVMSGSMETSIYTGDLIFTRDVDPNTLKVGDVIAFREDNDFVTTHRIIDIKNVDGKKYFATKGDNNNTADKQLVALDKVEGIYISRIPGLGNALVFLQKPIGLVTVLAVILIFGLIIFSVSGSLSSKEMQKVDDDLLKELEELRQEKKLREEKDKSNDKEKKDK